MNRTEHANDRPSGPGPSLKAVLEAAEQAGLLDDRARAYIEAVWRSGDADAKNTLHQYYEAAALHQRVVNDPFAPHPKREALEAPGLLIGHVPGADAGFCLTNDDADGGGILLSGSPRSGKTNTAYGLIDGFIQGGPALGESVVWTSDLRDDYVGLARHIPRLIVVRRVDERWNILRPPTGMPLRDWYQQWSTLFIEFYALKTGSRQYLIKMMDTLAEWHEHTNHYPCMADLRDLLEAQEPKPRSDEEGYRDRCLERVDAFLRETGAMTQCERGFDYEKLMNEGISIVFENDLSKQTADFITALRILYVYCFRRYNDDRPHHRFVFVLDEQRHLIRSRS